MQKTVVRNPNQSSIRRNLLNIAGITVQGETITPQNGDRLLGGYGVAWLNNQDAASQTTGQDNPLPECNCESGGGGGGSGGGGGVQPSGNCEKKNISELKQVLDDYANQSFCDKEFPEVQFSTFIGKDSSGNESEIRLLCPVDECGHEQSYTYKIGTYRIPCNSAHNTVVKFEHGAAIDDTYFEMKLKKFSSKQDFVNFHNKCLNEAVALIEDTSCYEVVYATENDVSIYNNLGGTDTNLVPSAFYHMKPGVGLKKIKRCYCDLDNYWISGVLFCFMDAGGTYYPPHQREVSRWWCFS